MWSVMGSFETGLRTTGLETEPISLRVWASWEACADGGTGGGIGCGRWRRTLLIELLQFLLGGLVARVDLDGAAELG